MVKRDESRPVGAFSRAISAEVKGLMASKGITQKQFADAISRNQGYVSERANGIKAFSIDELDTFAGLIGMDSKALLTIVAKRVEDQDSRADVVHLERRRKPHVHSIRAVASTDDGLPDAIDGDDQPNDPFHSA